MATPYERTRADLVRRLQLGETEDLRTRCDASGIPLAEVQSCAGLATVPRLDARGRPRDQLVNNEHLVQANGKQLACRCDAEVCDCRPLATGGSGATKSSSRGTRHDRFDSGVLIPPEPANPDALAFGQINLGKARAWLGAERFAEVRAADDLEWKTQNAVTPGLDSALAYRGLLIATIGAAYPDLADRAATESMLWLRQQYSALPDPDTDTEPDQENTDMAQDDQDNFDPFAARRAAATAFARFDSQGGATSMTPAEQKAELDKAEARFDAQVGRECYLRLARAVRGQDALLLRTDKADSGKPKKNALQRAMGRLQKIYDDAESGTLDRRGAEEAAKILDSIAELHQQAGAEADDEEKTARADADDPLQAAAPKRPDSTHFEKEHTPP